MLVRALDHVQLAMPAGGEVDARAFYAGLLVFPKRRSPRTSQGAAAVGLSEAH